MKRECGNCSLCCKVMGVPEIKPDHDWCQHAKPGHGCAIYRQRPQPCRTFHCMWLLDQAFGEHWFPARAKIVINTLVENGKKYVSFVVDPDYPLRWREEPWFSDIKHIAKAGLVERRGEKWTTLVVIKDQRIPIIGTPRLLQPATRTSP